MNILKNIFQKETNDMAILFYVVILSVILKT